MTLELKKHINNIKLDPSKHLIVSKYIPKKTFFWLTFSKLWIISIIFIKDLFWKWFILKIKN